MKRVLGLVVGVCMFSLSIVGCSAGKTEIKPAETKAETTKANAKVMKIGSVNSKERSLSKGLVKFAELVEKESAGAIKVEVYTDGVLGDDNRTLEGLQIGSIQGTTVSTGPISSFVKEIGIFDLPFLFKDKATAYKVLDGDIGKGLLSKLENSGFIALSYWENGFRHTTNSKREITTLEDFKGLKIRTMESQIHIDIWKALGANPTPMSYTQLYTGLEQKVVDGQENPLGNVKTAKFYEVQKYLTLDGHVYNASPFLLSKVFWNTLNDKEKEIMKKAAKEAGDYQRQMNEQEDKDSIKYLTDKNMKISELKPGEKEKMRAAVQSVYEKNKSTFGQELVNKLLDATK